MAFKHQALYGDLRSSIFSLSFIKQTKKILASITTFLSKFYLNHNNLRWGLKYICLSAFIFPSGNFCTMLFITSLMYCLSVIMRWDSLWICLQYDRHHDRKMCSFCFNIFFTTRESNFLQNLEKSKPVQLLNTFMGCSLKTDGGN